MPSTDRTPGESGRADAPASRLLDFVRDGVVSGTIAADSRGRDLGALDDRTAALANLAALIAVGAAPASYRSVVGEALDLGVGDDEIIGLMLAVAPTVGLPRLVASSVSVASALGYDTEAALESPDPPRAADVRDPRESTPQRHAK